MLTFRVAERLKKIRPVATMSAVVINKTRFTWFRMWCTISAFHITGWAIFTVWVNSEHVFTSGGGNRSHWNDQYDYLTVLTFHIKKRNNKYNQLFCFRSLRPNCSCSGCVRPLCRRKEDHFRKFQLSMIHWCIRRIGRRVQDVHMPEKQIFDQIKAVDFLVSVDIWEMD